MARSAVLRGRQLMGKHMMQTAAAVDLPPRLKVALMCFAESARDGDRIAFPGDDELMKWAGVKKAQLHNLINRLLELQLLERTQRACRNRRAEYRLFPNGCCVAHGLTPSASSVDDAEVVVIGVSTGPVVHARPVDPLPGVLGPIETSNGSNPGAEWVQSPRSKSAASYKHSKNTPGSTTDRQPPTSRETASDVSIQFVDPSPATGVVVRTPSGSALGCRYCDAGFVTDRDGLPVAKCSHCHPAVRRSEGRTA
jgi:hypothetical protein